MLKIDGNQNITLTRGDTLTMTVTLLQEVEPVPPATEPTIEPYVPEVDIPKSGGGTAKFYDTAGADAAAGDILSGKSAFNSSGSISGSMANNGSTGGTISTKAGSITIPAGYTSGGTVSISSTEQSKIIASNIKSGVTILGQAGSLALPSISQDSTTKILSIS